MTLNETELQNVDYFRFRYLNTAMSGLLAALLMFATETASAVQIGFDNIPEQSYANGSLVYREEGP